MTAHSFRRTTGRRLALIAAIAAGILFSPQTARTEEVTLTLNGLTLNGNLELAAGKTIGDGIILITHGTFTDNKTEIVATLQALFRERSLNTLAINLSLGFDNRHGAYDCVTPIDSRHAGAITEIAAWVDWLGNRGGDNILLLGHSRGGNQTAWYMAEYDDNRVRGGVLVAPATWDFGKAAESYLKTNKKRLPALLEDMKKRIAAGNGDDMIRDVALLYCPKATLTAKTFVSYYEDNPLKDTPRTLTRVTRPVMVIGGSEDTVVPDLVEKMTKSPPPGVRLEVIDGAGHFFRDLYAEDIADLTVDFIENLP